MARINIEIPDEVHKKVKVACALKEMTLIAFVHDAIQKKLSSEKEESVE